MISWREIPAQVTAGKGAAHLGRCSPTLPGGDRLGCDAGRPDGTDAHLEEWRREARACGDDLDAEVAAAAALLQAEYTDERLE